MVASSSTADPVAGAPLDAGELVTRERLIQAAVKAFSATGFEGVSVREVERQAGVNRGLVGYHFGSKDQLWKSCIDWLMAGCHAEMQRYTDLLPVVSGPERRKVLLSAFIEYVSRRPEFFRMVVIEGAEPSERTRWAVDGLRDTLSFFDGLSGRPSAGPREDAAAAYMVLGATSMIFAVPEQCRHLFGVDPADPAFVAKFARSVAGLGIFDPDDPAESAQPAEPAEPR
jgi:AcrR family transcriptional regulator